MNLADFPAELKVKGLTNNSFFDCPFECDKLRKLATNFPQPRANWYNLATNLRPQVSWPNHLTGKYLRSRKYREISFAIRKLTTFMTISHYSVLAASMGTAKHLLYCKIDRDM